LKVTAIGIGLLLVSSLFTQAVAPELKACLPPDAGQWGAQLCIFSG